MRILARWVFTRDEYDAGMNGQACHVQITTRRLSWGMRTTQDEVENVALALAAFPNIRLRTSETVPGLRVPVEAAVSVHAHLCSPHSLEFAWRQRDGVTLPSILGKVSVHRVFGFLRIFEFTAEYDVPSDLATRVYDDVVGKWVVLALMERFSKYVLKVSARQIA